MGFSKVRAGFFNTKRQKNYKEVYEKNSSVPVESHAYESRINGGLNTSMLAPSHETGQSSFEIINT
jgi:hypothetical protein